MSSSNSGSLISVYALKASNMVFATKYLAEGLSSAGMVYHGACGFDVLLMASS